MNVMSGLRRRRWMVHRNVGILEPTPPLDFLLFFPFLWCFLLLPTSLWLAS